MCLHVHGECVCEYLYNLHACYVCNYMWVGVYQCMNMVCECVRVYVRASSCVCCVLQCLRTRSCDPNSVTEGSDLCMLWTPSTGDSKTIHEITQRFIPVRLVKTRWRFEPKIMSFHLSVCSYVFFLVANRCSCSYSYYFMWLSDLFTSMIIRITS